MRTLYRLHSFFLISVTLILGSCSQNLTYQEANDKNERKIDDPTRLVDARFLVDARSFNILEKKLAELATTTGYASKIVDFGRATIDEQNNFGKELEKLAYKEKIAIPALMNDQHQSLYNELVSVARENFDKEYLRIIDKVNEEILQKFETMATEASDSDIRAFAARRLDMLRNQERNINEVEDALLHTY